MRSISYVLASGRGCIRASISSIKKVGRNCGSVQAFVILASSIKPCSLFTKVSQLLLKHPKSLFVRVLCTRYIKDHNFLRAQMGSNPSYTWRSIIWARYLFKKGFRWKVDNGRRIKIDHDPWINRKGSCMPTFYIMPWSFGREVGSWPFLGLMWLEWGVYLEQVPSFDVEVILNTHVAIEIIF